MSKYLAYYENEWPANIAELTAVENKPFVGYLKGEGVQYTVIPKNDLYTITLYSFKKNNSTINDYEAVDLGLPSGTKWANKNVNAVSVEDIGSYFSYGSLDGYDLVFHTVSATKLLELMRLLLSNDEELQNVTDLELFEYLKDAKYSILRDVIFHGSGNIENPETQIGNNYELFGWNLFLEYLYNEMLTDLYPNYNTFILDTFGIEILSGVFTEQNYNITSYQDAATVNMGNDWVIPSIADVEELLLNTDKVAVDLNGVEHSLDNCGDDIGTIKEIKYISKINNNSISIPASGQATGYDGGQIAENVTLMIYYRSVVNAKVSDEKHVLWNTGLNATVNYFGDPIRGVKRS